MKLAVSGKGGVGKTLVAAMLAQEMSVAGYSVIAVDADPDANLALTLGFPDADKIVPISEARIAQFYAHSSNPVEKLYSGQFLEKKD